MRLKWPTLGRRKGDDPPPEDAVPLAPRAPRRAYRERDVPRAGSVVPRLLLGFAVVYAVLLFAFWIIHYEGPRPAAGRVVKDFHAFLGLGPEEARAAPPPTPEPKRKTPPVPVARPAPPPPAPAEPSRLDVIADTIRRVEKDAKSIRALSRGGELEAARLELMSSLCEARDTLNVILDANPDDYRANGLWDKLQRVLVALRKF